MNYKPIRLFHLAGAVAVLALAHGSGTMSLAGRGKKPREELAAMVNLSFTLPATQTTSAGVYSADGALVRTLWRRERHTAGRHTFVWDGKDDKGAGLPPQAYTIKMIAHDIRYVWDGVVGNTSSSFTGGAVWFTGSPVESLAAGGGTMYVASGYQEGTPELLSFDLSNPQTRVPLPLIQPDAIFSSIAVDPSYVYAAHSGRNDDPSLNTFVVRRSRSTGQEAPFSKGSTITMVTSLRTVYKGVADAATGDIGAKAASGLAVQQKGSMLAVAHAGQNVVRIFDKNTGVPLSSISVPSPRGVAFSPKGDLWVISNKSVIRYTSDLNVFTKVGTIAGFDTPLNVATSPTGSDLVVVADGGSDQRLKAYTSKGKLVRIYGQLGGYEANGPAVTNDKFAFGAKAPLAMVDDGSLWVGDVATRRLIHISLEGHYLEQIAWHTPDYCATVDLNDPTRVFAHGFLEYKVDYSKELQPGDPSSARGNGSWKIERNWATKSLTTTGSDGSNGLSTVVTLKNNRTYGTVFTRVNDGGGFEVMELTALGLRDTGTFLRSGFNPDPQWTLNKDGDLIKAITLMGVQTISRRTLKGFDASGNPAWGPETVIATLPGSKDDPIGGNAPSGPAGWQFPISETGVIASFNGAGVGNGATLATMHLGGAKIGSDRWLWKASPSVTTSIPLDGKGSFQIASVVYAGNQLVGAGRHFIYGYHGEFWNDSQANQFAHYRDDGLFLGQFGVPMDVKTPEYNAMPGKAGNTYTPQLVAKDGEYYLWHGEESNHGGLHRWHIVGADAIQEFKATATLGASVELAAQPTTFPTGLRAKTMSNAVQLAWNPVAGAKSYSVSYATRSGGPYLPLKDVNGSTSYTADSLVNGVDYYFVVKANGGTTSCEVRATPMEDGWTVQGIASLGYWGSASTLPLDDDAGSWGAAPLFLHSMFETLGLKESGVGTEGYALFNADAKHGVESHLNGKFQVTLGGKWKYYDNNTAVTYRRASTTLSGASMHADTTGYIDIVPADNDWHVMTVVNPNTSANQRCDSITVTSLKDPSRSATYRADDNYTYDVVQGYVYLRGFNRIHQFRFRGPVRITLQQLKSMFSDNANLSGLFFDEGGAYLGTSN